MTRRAGAGSVTMYDVARRAGVSHQTVSRVMNSRGHVRVSTAQRVRQAMEELGYRPSASAQSLAGRRSTTVGVITFNGPLFGPSSTLQSVEREARGHGYAVLSIALHGCDDDEVQDAVAELLRRDVAGVLVVAPRDDEQGWLGLLPEHLPVVALEAALPGHPLVASDNEAGGVLVARHLLGLGHRRVVHVAGPPDWSESRLRSSGFERVLREAGAPPVETLAGDWSARSGYAAGVAVAQEDVTAVFAANDQMALGVLTALHRAGRRVPDDISVVGYDDHPDSAWYLPALTTVEQGFHAVGVAGITAMMQAIGGVVPAGALIPPRLVERESTAAPERSSPRSSPGS